ncbi:MAG: DNA polymerase IV, partial [Alphaproteobacteria bacterium]
RLIGVGISELVEAGSVEGDFFGEAEKRSLASEKTADALRARFGATALTSGRALNRKASETD